MPSPTRARLTLSPALIALVTSVGCFDADVADVAALACASDVDCPQGAICRVQLGRCISTVDLDNEGPTLLVVRLEPAVARAGDQVTLSFSVSEALARPPTVFVAGASAIDFDLVDADDTTFTFRHVVTDDDAEGRHSLTVDLVDAAGNAVAANVGTFVIDRSGPVVDTDSIEITPAVSAPGATVSVRVVASEPVIEPQLQVGEGSAATIIEGESSALGVLSFTFAAPTLTGSASLRLVAPRDAAGNVGVAAAIGTLVVDADAPGFVSVTLSGTQLSRQPGFQTLTITATVDDDDSIVSLVVGGVAGACGRDPESLEVFQCGFSACADDECRQLRLADGVYLAVLEATDPVGQRAVRTTPVIVDTIAPAVVALSVPPAVRASSLVTVELELTELPCDAPRLQIENGAQVVVVDGIASGVGRVQFSFVAPRQDGDYSLTMTDVVDCAGNAVEVDAAHMIVDGTPPVIDGLPASFGRLGAVSLVFDVGVSGETTDDIDVVAGLDNGVNTPCERVADGVRRCTVDTEAAAEGAQTVLVSAIDAVGNPGTARRNVTLDRRAPDVVGGGAFLLLTPPPASGLLVAERATVATAVLLGIALDEASAEPPVLLEDTLGLSIVSAAAGGTFYRFAFTIDAPAPTPVHTCSLQIEVVDDVGNRAVRDVALPTPLIIDTEAPNAPPAAACVLQREPFGSRASSTPRFQVLIDPATTFESGATLLAIDDVGLELGRRAVGADGHVANVVLPSPDRTRVAVRLIDNAGNSSPSTTVTQGVVVANARSLGETENPHRVQGLGGALTLATTGAGPLLARDAVAADDGDVEVIEGAVEWDVRETEMPPAMTLPSLIADPARGAVLMLGGFTAGSSGDQDRTWRFTQQWRPVSPADPEEDGNPPKGRRFISAYDAGRDAIVITAGDNFSGIKRTDVWEWNGRSYKLVTLSDPEGDGNPPAASSSDPFRHAIGYDAARGDVILYQQASAAGQSPATWRFRGTSWQRLLPDDPEGDGNPDLPTHAVMAFDPSRQVLMLRGDACRQNGGSFGCGGSTGGIANEQQWTWNGRSWRKDPLPVPNGTTVPAARGTTIVTDRSGGRVLLVGTQTFIAGSPFSIFEWKGQSWTRLENRTTAQVAPHGLAFSSTAFDAARGRLVMFGRSGDTNTYLWSDVGGLAVQPSHDAEGDGDVNLRFNAIAGGGDLGNRAVIFGGFNATGTSSGYHDPWRWTGSSWAKLPNGSYPLDGAAVAFDSLRDTIVIFGGTTSGGSLSAQLLEITPQNTLAVRTPVDPEGDGNPGPRFFSVAGFDPVRGRTVIAGGADFSADLDEVWEWNGASFVRVTPVDPEGDGNPTQFGAGRFAWSDVEQALVLIGGTSTFEPGGNTGTWAWDGVSFRRLDDDSPLFLVGGMAAVLGNGDVVATGGLIGGDDVTNTALLRLRDGQWRSIPVRDALGDGDLPGLFQPQAFFDRVRGQFVGFGVRDRNGLRTGHTALLNPGEVGRPIAAVSASRSALPPDAVLTDVVVSGVAGAGTVGVDDGVDVVVWDTDGWRRRANFVDADATAPAAGVVVVTLDSLVPVVVGLTARSAEQLVVDSVELALRYERLIP